MKEEGGEMVPKLRFPCLAVRSLVCATLEGTSTLMTSFPGKPWRNLPQYTSEVTEQQHPNWQLKMNL